MSKDLTKVNNTISTVFIVIIPVLEALNQVSYLTDEDKKDHAIDFTVEVLTKVADTYKSDSNDYQLYREQITKVRNIMTTKDDIKQIIYYMNCVIKTNK